MPTLDELLENAYDINRAAEYCGVSPHTIRFHSVPSYRGPYPLHPIPELRQKLGRVYFTKEELDRWRSLNRKPGRRYNG